MMTTTTTTLSCRRYSRQGKNQLATNSYHIIPSVFQNTPAKFRNCPPLAYGLNDIMQQ